MNTEKINKRVVFTMGGKGGVGKTGLMVALAEWFEAHEIPFTLLDLDTENKARGSLKHFFNGSVAKVNIHTPVRSRCIRRSSRIRCGDHPRRHGSRFGADSE
jgi:MinD superfamily P-loop ATPase